MIRTRSPMTHNHARERLIQKLIGMSVAVLLCGGALLLSSCSCPTNAYCGEPVSPQ